MQAWVNTVSSNFQFSPKVKCSPHSGTSVLDEKDEKTKKPIASYNITFVTPGICIQGFDAVKQGNLKGGKSFDVLSASNTSIRYIELKSSFGLTELEKIGDKFFCGHPKAAQVLSVLINPLPADPEYIVIFTKDMVKASFNSRKKEDLSNLRKLNQAQSHLHAWKNDKVLLTSKTKGCSLVKPFCDGEIPITKHHYDGSTPINFS